jgi:hypothetical protein
VSEGPKIDKTVLKKKSKIGRFNYLTSRLIINALKWRNKQWHKIESPEIE